MATSSDGRKAGDGAQRGGLAGAVGTDQRDDLAFRYFERDALDCGGDAVVDNFELTDLEERVVDQGHRRVVSSGR